MPRIVLALFFLSGASGLVYEVVATRLLRVVMGNTVLTTTTVLTSFMAGLALGSLIGGRLADIYGRPLRLFAWFELGAGLYCLGLPWLIDASHPVYRAVFQRYDLSFYALGLFKFAFCGALIMVPAIAMGASLPALVRWLNHRPEDVGPWLGKLYAGNSSGAALGAAGAAFALLPALGTSRTLYLACAVNVATGIVAWLLVLRQRLNEGLQPCGVALDVGAAEPRACSAVFRASQQSRVDARLAAREPAQSPLTISAPSPLSRNDIAGANRLLAASLLVVYASSGFASLIYEVSWTRTLSLLIGSSVYAFSLILTTFILGLALGSLIWTRLAAGRRRRWAWLVAVQLGAAGFALLSMPLCSRLPELLPAWISMAGSSFWKLQALEFAVIATVMLPPTILLGATFPAICQLYAQATSSVGRSIGAVYAAGSLGSILGASIGGLLLIPWLGLQATIWVGALFNIEGATLLALLQPGMRLSRRLALGLMLQVLAITCGAWLPAWDIGRMTTGPEYVARGGNVGAGEVPAASEAPGEVIFYKEDNATTVTVRESPDGGRRLYTDGAPEAASEAESTQALLAHAPLLFHSSAKNVLVIGLGSGITLGCAAMHPLDRLDCVELSPGVVQAAHWFDAYNRRALTDPRVNLHIGDGRNFLELTDRPYDVIISQPSNLWIAGVGDLYTREFFSLCARRMQPGGLACVWLNALDLDEPLFRSVLGTFQDVFPHATLWEPSESNFLLLGSQTPWQVDGRRLADTMETPDLQGDLRRVGIESPADLLGRFVLGQPSLGQFTRDASRHTDDNSLLEFSSPRTLYRAHLETATQKTLQPIRGQGLAAMVDRGGDLSAGLLQQAQSRIRAAGYVRAATIDLLEGRQNLSIARFRSAAELNPRDPDLRRRVHGVLRRAAAAHETGNHEDASKLYRLALAMNPSDADAHHQWGVVLSQTGQRPQAEQELSAAVRLDASHVEAQYSLGSLLAESGYGDRARGHFEAALQANPMHARSAGNLAGILIQEGDFSEALLLCQQALEVKPDLVEARFNLGLAFAGLGRRDEALEAMRKVLRQEPDNPYAATALRELLEAGR